MYKYFDSKFLMPGQKRDQKKMKDIVHNAEKS